MTRGISTRLYNSYRAEPPDAHYGVGPKCPAVCTAFWIIPADRRAPIGVDPALVNECVAIGVGRYTEISCASRCAAAGAVGKPDTRDRHAWHWLTRGHWVTRGVDEHASRGHGESARRCAGFRRNDTAVEATRHSEAKGQQNYIRGLIISHGYLPPGLTTIVVTPSTKERISCGDRCAK